VPEIVEHERADWLVIVLLYLFVQRFENSLMLHLEHGFLDVFALGRAVKTQPSFVGKLICANHSVVYRGEVLSDLGRRPTILILPPGQNCGLNRKERERRWWYHAPVVS